MQVGLFGKLPAKRDFVSYGLPRPFLDGWEQWLQAGIAESRHALGESWKQIYLTLPIWRFWCGPEVFGSAATGAIMPSVDGVGRYFPLSICACTQADETPATPPHAALNDWLEACEQSLLAHLDDQVVFDPVAMLNGLGLPPARRIAPLMPTAPGIHLWSAPRHTLGQAFEELSAADHLSVARQRGLWWTLGGENYPPALIVTEGSPSPALWQTFMTGQVAA